MKTKEYIALGLLAVILIVMGTVLVGKFGNGGKKRSAQVEVVQLIDTEFNKEARDIILGRNNDQPAQSLPPPADLKQGFGNNNPFIPGS